MKNITGMKKAVSFGLATLMVASVALTDVMPVVAANEYEPSQDAAGYAQMATDAASLEAAAEQAKNDAVAAQAAAEQAKKEAEEAQQVADTALKDAQAAVFNRGVENTVASGAAITSGLAESGATKAVNDAEKAIENFNKALENSTIDESADKAKAQAEIAASAKDTAENAAADSKAQLENVIFSDTATDEAKAEAADAIIDNLADAKKAESDAKIAAAKAEAAYWAALMKYNELKRLEGIADAKEKTAEGSIAAAELVVDDAKKALDLAEENYKKAMEGHDDAAKAAEKAAGALDTAKAADVEAALQADAADTASDIAAEKASGVQDILSKAENNGLTVGEYTATTEAALKNKNEVHAVQDAIIASAEAEKAEAEGKVTNLEQANTTALNSTEYTGAVSTVANAQAKSNVVDHYEKEWYDIFGWGEKPVYKTNEQVWQATIAANQDTASKTTSDVKGTHEEYDYSTYTEEKDYWLFGWHYKTVEHKHYKTVNDYYTQEEIDAAKAAVADSQSKLDAYNTAKTTKSSVENTVATNKAEIESQKSVISAKVAAITEAQGKNNDADTAYNTAAAAEIAAKAKVDQYVIADSAVYKTNEGYNLSSEVTSFIEELEADVAESETKYETVKNDATGYMQAEITHKFQSWDGVWQVIKGAFTGDTWKDINKAWNLESKYHDEVWYSRNPDGTNHTFIFIDNENNAKVIVEIADNSLKLLSCDKIELSTANSSADAAIASAAAADAANAATATAAAKKAVEKEYAHVAILKNTEAVQLATLAAATKKVEDAQAAVKELKVNGTKGDLAAAKEALEAAKSAYETAKSDYADAKDATVQAAAYAAYASLYATSVSTGMFLSNDAEVKADQTDVEVKSQDSNGYTTIATVNAPVALSGVSKKIYEAYVKRMYDVYGTNNYDVKKNVVNLPAGQGIATGNANTPAGEATMPVIYWTYEEKNGKTVLTGDSYTYAELVAYAQANGMEASNLSVFVGYAFKHESDGYHMDGVFVDVAIPAIPVAPSQPAGDEEVSAPVVAQVPVVNAPATAPRTAAVAAAPAVEQIEDEQTPLAVEAKTEEPKESKETKIEDEETPLAIEDSWAVLNLVFAIIAIIMVAISIIASKKSDDKEDKSANVYTIMTGIAALASIITFVLTEDMTANMQLADRWTLLMIVYVVVQVAFLAVAKQEQQKTVEAK